MHTVDKQLKFLMLGYLNMITEPTERNRIKKIILTILCSSHYTTYRRQIENGHEKMMMMSSETGNSRCTTCTVNMNLLSHQQVLIVCL